MEAEREYAVFNKFVVSVTIDSFRKVEYSVTNFCVCRIHLIVDAG